LRQQAETLRKLDAGDTQRSVAGLFNVSQAKFAVTEAPLPFPLVFTQSNKQL
jgi:hypothetical protein